MLSQELRRLGRYLIPIAIITWGLFAIIFSGHLDDIPAPIWWLGIVFGIAAGLAGLAGLWFRAKARNKARW